MLFGERQDPKSQYSAVIPQFITKACVEKEDIYIYGDGKQTRDFVYVKDVVNANVYASKNLKSGVYNGFNKLFLKK
jgi:UDP-glucose 4-epimerase